MKTGVVAAVVLLLGGLTVTEPLLACGEKFLMRSRGTRFQRAPVPASASVLIYANPAFNLSKSLASIPFDATLRKAGYRPATVTTQSEFDTSLQRGGWDLVLVDIGDSDEVAKRLQDSRAVVLPVIFNPSNAEMASAKEHHSHVLKAPTKNQSFLNAIEEALAQKVATQVKGRDTSAR